MTSQQQLLGQLIKTNILKTPQIIEAFKKVDRADFVLPEFLTQAYEDYPLPIGFDQTISQPTTVAIMLELLQPYRGEKILDIGSGSGWTTTLLGQITGVHGRILGIEIIPELVKLGQVNLAKYHLAQAKILLANKKLGLTQHAPFSKILVSAAATSLPQELVGQLKIKGRLVLPINNSIWQIDKISDDQIRIKEYYGFSFVPLK